MSHTGDTCRKRFTSNCDLDNHKEEKSLSSDAFDNDIVFKSDLSKRNISITKGDICDKSFTSNCDRDTNKEGESLSRTEFDNGFIFKSDLSNQNRTITKD
ncbi:hypothetical protein NPIL_187761 [Nephila pilipes]|uniref:Uncharacterized protein n=1 Tax=Nephila pilipes TaxID=299642 RepID=A0A8X6NDW7_NEPPI|nr:hypothetical protein NPIL_187761 [Nephila pilipes]